LDLGSLDEPLFIDSLVDLASVTRGVRNLGFWPLVLIRLHADILA
jgi:hypothetical protein